MPRYVKEAGSTGTLEQKNNTTQHKYEIDMDNKVGNTRIVTFLLLRIVTWKSKAHL